MDLEEILAQQLQKVIGDKLPQGEMVSKAQVEDMLSSLKTDLTASIEGLVQKALPLDREGTGRKEVVKTAEEAALENFENDPANFLVKKGEATSTQEKQVAVALFKKVMGEGLV